MKYTITIDTYTSRVYFETHNSTQALALMQNMADMIVPDESRGVKITLEVEGKIKEEDF